MVSKASEDLPEPDTPVTTVSLSTGMEKETFFRLLTRAPRTMIASWLMSGKHTPRPTVDSTALRRTGHDNLFFAAGETDRSYSWTALPAGDVSPPAGLSSAAWKAAAV